MADREATEPDPVAVNRANWDARAAVHGQDRYYDTAGLLSGADTLTDVEWAGVRAAVGTVSGLDVLHVQCHLGFGSITLARHGARVTGVDFSGVALTRAAELAERCGVPVRFVQAEATALPADLHGRFDLAFATIGVLCWIGDVDAWMASVAATLRPGGRLLLVDFHPARTMAESLDPLVLDFPYAFDGPHRFDEPGSYADRSAVLAATANVQYAHSVGEIVTAAADAGLRVVALTEHLDSPGDPSGREAADPDGRYRFRISGQCLPMLYTLLAEQPTG